MPQLVPWMPFLNVSVRELAAGRAVQLLGRMRFGRQGSQSVWYILGRCIFS